MNLSVGFVVSHPFHGSPGSVLRVRELSRSLSATGVTVHIYSPYTFDQTWGHNIYFHKLPSLVSKLGLSDVTYGLARRVLNNSFLVKKVLNRRILDRQIDALAESISSVIKEDLDILQGEQEIAAAACVKAGKTIGVPVVSSLHNIWPEELVVMNLIKKTSAQYDLLMDLEKSIVTNSDLVIAVSEEMKTYLKNTFSVDDNVALISPGGRARLNQVPAKSLPFKVIYAGLVVPRAHVDLFVKSIPFVLEKYPNAEFYITKRGEDLQKIHQIAENVGANPQFYWFNNDETFYQFLASCHVGVVTSSNDLPRRLGPAVKLFDYLSVGLPVVANDIGGWTKIINEEHIGILTNDDPESFSQGIIALLDNQALSQNFSEKGLELITTKLNWDSSAKLLLDRYEALLS